MCKGDSPERPAGRVAKGNFLRSSVKWDRTADLTAKRMRGENLVVLQPQHVVHAVKSGFLPGEPSGGADSAVGEGITAVGAVNELEALADAAENHRMLADDVAGAD